MKQAFTLYSNINSATKNKTTEVTNQKSRIKKEWRKIKTAYDQHYKSTKRNQITEDSTQQKQNTLSSEVHTKHYKDVPYVNHKKVSVHLKIMKTISLTKMEWNYKAKTEGKLEIHQ